MEYYTNKYIKQREIIDSQLLIKDNDEQETYNSSVNSWSVILGVEELKIFHYTEISIKFLFLIWYKVF